MDNKRFVESLDTTDYVLLPRSRYEELLLAEDWLKNYAAKLEKEGGKPNA